MGALQMIHQGFRVLFHIVTDMEHQFAAVGKHQNQPFDDKVSAAAAQSAEDLLLAMRWPNPLASNAKPVQQTLFPSLTEDEALVARTLQGVEDKQVNQIVVETGLSFSRVSTIMFELELKGVVRVLGGARYKLITHH